MKNFFVKKPKTGYIDIDLDSKFESCYKKYKKSAEERGYEFDISKNQFKHVVLSKCFYCGADPSKYSDGTTRNGVDRVDNTKGYYYDNVISSCKLCNAMKKDHTYTDFLLHIEKIHKTLKEHADFREVWNVESFQFKAYMFNFGRYLSPNELLECLNLKLIKKKDVLYSFKMALREFPKEYEIVKSQLLANIPKFHLKKFTVDYYNCMQMKEWNFYK